MKLTMSSPCENCPFVRSVRFHLRPKRVDEIALRVGAGFPCHKTTTAGGAENDRNRVHCAGSLILQWKAYGGFDGWVTWEASRLFEEEGWHPDKDLDLGADVFDSFDEMREAMEELERGGGR